MIHRCPHCGLELSKALSDGLTSCYKCNAIFESSEYNTLLSSAWELVRGKPVDLEQFKFFTKLSHDEAQFVYKAIMEDGYTIDEFRKMIRHGKETTT